MLLDVGGPGLATILLTAHVETVIVLNVDVASLSPNHVDGATSMQRIVGDGGNLPFADNSVDFVLSDNVIEHVPDRERFAAEVMRVARRGVFLTTPNYWFPFEPHYHMPFFQFLPRAVRSQLLKLFDFGFAGRDSFIELLTARELKTLLPGANVEGIAFFVLPETLIAWCRK